MTNNNPSKNTNPNFDRKRFKDAIAWVESSGGKNLTNKNSSAAGRYHFLYRYIKNLPMLKGVSKLEFVNSPKLQEKVMDMALDGQLKGFPNYIKYANELKSKFGSNLKSEEVAALVHFLGRSGARNYFINKNNFKVPGKNATVDQYLKRFRSGYGPIKDINGNIPKLKKDVNVQAKDNIPTIPKPQAKQEQVPDAMNDIGPQQPRKFIDTQYTALDNGQNDVINLLNNPKAYGGEVENNNSTRDLVRFDAGGTHEQNPYGGLPIGTDNNGQMNTVEEGETKFKFKDGDYVFSDRIGMYNSSKSNLNSGQYGNGGLTGDPIYPKKKRDSILNANKNLNFVKRILDPSLNKGKGIHVKGTEDNSISSHYMSYSEQDGKYYVYPTVVDTGKNKFEYLGNKAFKHAIKSKEYIKFNSEKEANDFSSNGYKTKKFKNSF